MEDDSRTDEGKSGKGIAMEKEAEKGFCANEFFKAISNDCDLESALKVLGNEEKAKRIREIEQQIDSLTRWMESLRQQQIATKESVLEALSLRDEIAIFLRDNPIPHVPGAKLRDIVIAALRRERKVCSGSLPSRLWNAIVLAVKGDPE